MSNLSSVLNWLYQDQADPGGLEDVLPYINKAFRQSISTQLLEIYMAIDVDPDLDIEDRSVIRSAMELLVDMVNSTPQQAELKLTVWISEHNADGNAHEYLASAYERMYGPE